MTGANLDARPSGSALEVFLAALRLGLTSFGGPVAHLGYIQHEYVERRHWLEETTFGHLVALCQLLPGPASSQLVIAIGTRRAGLTGGLVSLLAFTLPSAVVLALFGLLVREVDLSTAGWVHGLKLAAAAVVVQAVYVMARRLAPDWPRRIVALAAAAVALGWAVPAAQVGIIVAGALLGALLLPSRPDPAPEPAPSPVSRRLGIVALVAFLALLFGLPLLRVVPGGDAIAQFETFYRTGALVFGGGHVVLPLLHSSVVVPGWVTSDQFLAGYGAAQAVPGPLFTFAAYLGTVWAAPPTGILGATNAVVAIFLPSLLLVFGVLPFWDLLTGSIRFRRALAGTNAAVVGILLAALYSPIWVSAVHVPLDVAVVAAAVGLLASGHVPQIAVVALAAVAGQLIGT